MVKSGIWALAIGAMLVIGALPAHAQQQDNSKDRVIQVNPNAGQDQDDDSELMHSTTNPSGQSASKPKPKPQVEILDHIKISPEARLEMVAFRQAYRQIKSLDLAGTISGNFDVAGRKQDYSSPFTAQFAAPNQFRHDRGSAMLAGCDGRAGYAYVAQRAIYVKKDLDKKGDDVLSRLNKHIREVIEQEDPSLSEVLSADPAADLLSNVSEVAKLPDTEIEGKAYTTLQATMASATMKVMLDPQTHLIRRIVADEKKMLEMSGSADVKEASMTWDYTTVKTGGVVKEDTFAWVPPSDAVDTTGSEAASDSQQAGKGLVGKPAPDFKLANLEGKEVTLSQLKGNVVVVDIWATWCGPCVEGMPHLQALYEAKKGEGLQVLGVNMDDDRSRVAPFVQEHKLTFPILLDDGQSNIMQKYQSEALPTTVVIGKDGNVKKVIVGYDQDRGEQLVKAVEAELKKSDAQPEN